MPYKTLEERRAWELRNKDRRQASVRRRYAANPERWRLYCRKARFKKFYGITLEDYDRMYAAQEGKCEICDIFCQTLEVDHNHKTGKTRGLLCGNCNRGLGLFFDNINLLISAIKYLIRHFRI
jgi:recombination endonuclease VII